MFETQENGKKSQRFGNQMTKLNAMDEIPTKTTNEQKNWYKINHLFHLNHTKKTHTFFGGDHNRSKLHLVVGEIINRTHP